MEKRLQTLLNEKFGKNLDTCSQADLQPGRTFPGSDDSYKRRDPETS